MECSRRRGRACRLSAARGMTGRMAACAYRVILLDRARHAHEMPLRAPQPPLLPLLQRPNAFDFTLRAPVQLENLFGVSHENLASFRECNGMRVTPE